MNEILWREWTLIFFLKKTNVDFWKSDFSSLSLARRRRRSTLFVGSKSQIPLILALKIHFFDFFPVFFQDEWREWEWREWERISDEWREFTPFTLVNGVNRKLWMDTATIRM